MNLSVCIVTRNEEQSMERILHSVAGIGAEVIVTDTGSSDRTREVAAVLGARVSQIAWQDDFAAARNEALAQATCDWVLWLNPDEELLTRDAELFMSCLANDEAIGYTMRVQDQLKADLPEYFTETNQPRLFRRNVRARYCGRLHPAFEVPLEELGRRQGKKLFATDLIVRRHAHLSVATPDKLRWSKRLLELELQDRPNQLRYLIEYGRVLLWLNDPQGHVVLAQAVEQIKPVRDQPMAPGPSVGMLLEYLLTVSPRQSLSNLTRAEAQDLALRWFRKTPPIIWAIAQERFQSSDFVLASVLLEELVEMGRSGRYDHAAGFDPDVIGASALMNLGICYVRTEDLDKAASSFEQLLNHPVHGAQARQNYEMVRKLLGQRAG